MPEIVLEISACYLTYPQKIPVNKILLSPILQKRKMKHRR